MDNNIQGIFYDQKKKRNISNSPYINIRHKNILKLNSEENTSQLNSSEIQEESDNSRNYDDFRDIIRKKDKLIRQYIFKINELLLKADEDKYECLIKEKLIKNLKHKIDKLQQELLQKEFNDNNNISYNEDINILIQKNKSLESEIIKYKKKIIELNKKNNYLLEQNENLKKKI